MGTHKIYSGIQGKEITYQGVYMETAMNYLPLKREVFRTEKRLKIAITSMFSRRR